MNRSDETIGKEESNKHVSSSACFFFSAVNFSFSIHSRPRLSYSYLPRNISLSACEPRALCSSISGCALNESFLKNAQIRHENA